jgi:2-methylisocitrate lyase-like PEP mutase family enzyme
MTLTPADQHRRAVAFAELHRGPGAFVFPNPWDAGSARVLAGLGFKALATTSSGFAFTLGRSDGEADRDEVLAHCRALVAATPLPVAADLENGFAHDAAGVADTIRRAAAAGLVGGSIEDATGDPADPIHPIEVAVERVAAAVEAARALPFPFTLTARAENFLHGRPDLADTIRRLQAFEAAGADVLYAPGLTTEAEIRAVCDAVGRPVNVLAGSPALRASVADLGAWGVRRISLGGNLARTAVNALIGAATEIRDQGTFGYGVGVPSFQEIDKLMGAAGEG